MTTNNSKYDYYAYIVFASKDRKWGRWMQRKLRSYRLPYTHDEKEKNRDERCFPVLHDKGILNAGAEGLRTPIEQSKYLIVICSHNAQSDPGNIDEVISRFINSGADPSSIIPFIVDADKRPEENCFPNELQRLCRIKTILGANIHDSGKHNAFLKVVARMHGLKLEQLESEDLRRQKKAQKWIAAGMGAFLIAGGFVGYKAWDYYAPKTAYFADYIEKYGIPEGIGELSSKEAKSTGSHYEIVSSERKVRELRYVDENGDLKTHDPELLSERPSKIAYSYSGNGELDEAVWYNEKNKVLMRLDYINNKTIDVYVKRDDGVHDDGSYMLTGGSGDDAADVGDLSEDAVYRDEIIRYLVDYDKKGFMTELRYSGSEVYNTAATDSNGIAGLRFERDSSGRIEKVIYLINEEPGKSATDAEAYSPFDTEGGICGEIREYDDAYGLKNITRIEVSETGKSDTDKDPDEDPSEKTIRLMHEVYYDTEGNRRGEVTYENGPYGPVKATFIKDGDTTDYLFHYDEQGRPLEKFYIGYAYSGAYVVYEEIEYTDSGYIQKNEYSKRVYYPDEDGKKTKVEEYDENGVLDDECVYEYDEYGNLIRFETDLSPTYEERHPNTYLEALKEVERKYDENGRETEGHEEWRMTSGDTGFSAWKKEYDEDGRPIACNYYDADGNPTRRETHSYEDKDDGGYVETYITERLGNSYFSEYTKISEYGPG